ncbi:TPA: phage tail protein I [Klebsiella pneumoniae]|uniref:phage tail protein I n=1 Tax=Klebsiella pneumoniae TaxID=573 RepID=UPI000E2FCC7F|nr:phage tail protein I [Klebsiella pneumoniae]HBR1366663.1 phage tail protein I [Klebsiella pneumoniae]HBR2015010.1 phage tail protein I [Klebsiella pneumoniae]
MTDSSVLPPNATAVERAIDKAGADALAKIPVYLVRWVKNPDLCPVELLPWLAWERQVDTWNTTWSEQEKRSAIKRARYIHEHRGTPAAVRRALVDSPFGCEIIEWFDQSPPGDPYTFRLNVEQDDRPVTEFDHQDLKMAVMRAKNLRSWFSVHIFGRLQGEVYGAGYMYASEVSRQRITVTAVDLEPAELRIIPDEVQYVSVTLRPAIAEDKSFTVDVSDPAVAAVEVDGDQLKITGLKTGFCIVSVTASSGVVATISVDVVAVADFVITGQSLSKALFLLGDKTEDITIDYGDGVDSRDFTLKAADKTTGQVYVYPTRALTNGQEYRIRVKGAETISFCYSSSATAFYPLTELIQLKSGRTSIGRIASGCTSLYKIHPGALDGCPDIVTGTAAFSGCTALADVPVNLFARNTALESIKYFFENTAIASLPDISMLTRITSLEKTYAGTKITEIPVGYFDKNINVTSFMYAFYGCGLLASIPDGLFKYSANATDFSGVFQQCVSLTQLVGVVFAGAPNAVNFSYAFYGCSKLAVVDEDIFSENILAQNFSYVFYDCDSLTIIPPRLFARNVAATNFSYAFYGCDGIKIVPGGLLANNSKTIDVSFMFAYSSIEEVESGAFDGAVLLKDFYYTFYTCAKLRIIAPAIFYKNTQVIKFTATFRGCVALQSVDGGLFSKNVLATEFGSTFMSSGLLSIPPDLFSQNTAAVYFAYCFYGVPCEEIPESLLTNNVNCFSLSYMFAMSGVKNVAGNLLATLEKLTDVTFMFYSSGLAHIDEDFFQFNLEITSFKSTFSKCGNLVAIKNGLFRNNKKATSFEETFSYSGLETIPEGLFSGNTAATMYTKTFYSCAALETVPTNLITSMPASVISAGSFLEKSGVKAIPVGFLDTDASILTSNIFANCSRLIEIPAGLFNRLGVNAIYGVLTGCKNLVMDVNELFNLDSYATKNLTAMLSGCSGLTGSGLELIAKFPAATSYKNALYNCTGLNDYANIPAAWKQ